MILATVRPGPVLHVWRDGHEIAAVSLTPDATLRLVSDLLRAVPRLDLPRVEPERPPDWREV